MHACMNCSKGSSALTMPKRLFENKKNTSLLLLFEKLQKKNDLNLVPDLFILLSVHPKWCVDGEGGEDGVGLPYQYEVDPRRKIRIKFC